MDYLVNKNPSYVIILYCDFMLKEISDFLEIIRDKWTGKFIPYVPIEFLNLRKIKNLYNYNCDFCLTMNEYGKKLLKEINPDIEVKVLEHIVDKFEEYDSLTKLKIKNKLYGSNHKDKFIVGVVNANNTRKRLDLAIESFNLFNKYNPNSLLVIKTTKPNLNETKEPSYINLIKYATNKNIIIIDNFLDNPDLCELYNSFDIMINTTDCEGFGLTVFEAALCGSLTILPYHSSFTSLLPQYIIKETDESIKPPYCVNYDMVPYEYARTCVDYMDQANGVYSRFFLNAKKNSLDFRYTHPSFLQINKKIKTTYTISKCIQGENFYKDIESLVNEIKSKNLDEFQIRVTSDIQSIRYIKDSLYRLSTILKGYKLFYTRYSSLQSYIGENRPLVGIVNPEEIFKKMKYYFENPQQKINDVNILKQHTIKRFSSERICQQLKDILI